MADDAITTEKAPKKAPAAIPAVSDAAPVTPDPDPAPKPFRVQYRGQQPTVVIGIGAQGGEVEPDDILELWDRPTVDLLTRSELFVELAG